MWVGWCDNEWIQWVYKRRCAPVASSDSLEPARRRYVANVPSWYVHVINHDSGEVGENPLSLDFWLGVFCPRKLLLNHAGWNIDSIRSMVRRATVSAVGRKLIAVPFNKLNMRLLALSWLENGLN